VGAGVRLGSDVGGALGIVWGVAADAAVTAAEGSKSD